jgi:lipoprotein-releasing system ATP-binding protein
MSELQAEGIVKRFPVAGGELEILRGVNLELGAGESVGILGVSGSGKSTLLHIMGGLERPTAGRVLYERTDIYQLDGPALARHRNQGVGFVFQFHHLLPEFDAEENVMMPCLLAGWPKRRARERAQEMLREVGLEDRRQHGPGKLSGGERQRVAIARALALAPPVLLADEPTGNLDPYTSEQVEEILLRLNEEVGTALILVTHSEKLAGRLGKKCYLRGGRLES